MKALVNLSCFDIIRDAETNAISLINILEEINGQGFPLLIPQFCIFLLCEREEDEPVSYNAKLQIYNNEKEMFSMNVIIDFQGKRRTRTNIKFGGLAVMVPGKLLVRFTIGENVLSEFVIPASQVGITNVSKQNDADRTTN